MKPSKIERNDQTRVDESLQSEKPGPKVPASELDMKLSMDRPDHDFPGLVQRVR